MPAKDLSMFGKCLNLKNTISAVRRSKLPVFSMPGKTELTVTAQTVHFYSLLSLFIYAVAAGKKVVCAVVTTHSQTPTPLFSPSL